MSEWPQHRAELIEGLVDAEAPPVAHVRGGMREHRVAGRVAGRLAHPFKR